MALSAPPTISMAMAARMMPMSRFETEPAMFVVIMKSGKIQKDTRCGASAG